MGGLRIDNTRIEDAALMAVLREKYEKLQISPAEEEKTWARVAFSLGIYPSHLSAIRAGRRLPGPKLLRRLGLRRIVSYEKER